MALLVHHWKDVMDLWLVAVDGADDEALKPLLEYVATL
jgi:U3 small nucleolar RNA-associated protein 20